MVNVQIKVFFDSAFASCLIVQKVRKIKLAINKVSKHLKCMEVKIAQICGRGNIKWYYKFTVHPIFTYMVSYQRVKVTPCFQWVVHFRSATPRGQWKVKGQKFNTIVSKIETKLKQIEYAKNSSIVHSNDKLLVPNFKAQLMAAIFHQGATKDSGHYISVIRSTDKWYECNDHNIKSVEFKDFCSSKEV